MKFANYNESLGKPPSHEVILRCHPDDITHPYVLYRADMYRAQGKHVIVRSIGNPEA